MPIPRKQMFPNSTVRYICLLSLLAIPTFLVLDRQTQNKNFLTVSSLISVVVSFGNRGWEDSISALYGLILPLLMLVMTEDKLDNNLSSANYIVLIYVAGADSQCTCGMFFFFLIYVYLWICNFLSL